MNHYIFNKGGFLNKFKNSEIHFTKKIKKLGLLNCKNCIIHLHEKLFTRLELIRCENIIVIFDKEVYNVHIDLCNDITIHLNDKNKHLVYFYTCSNINITAEYKLKTLPIKHSMFNEAWMTSYYKDEVFCERYY